MKLPINKIRAIAAKTDKGQLPSEATVIDELLRAYWRMERPGKKQLLEEYRERCDDALSADWLAVHCHAAVLLETLIGEQAIPETIPR